MPAKEIRDAGLELCRRTLGCFCERVAGPGWEEIGWALEANGWAVPVIRDCLPSFIPSEQHDFAAELCRRCARELAGLATERPNPPSMFQVSMGLRERRPGYMDMLRKAFGRAGLR